MNWFTTYIYREANAKQGTAFEPGQDQATDSLATKIALDTGVANKIAPSQVISLLNSGLGTNFTLTDYNRAAKEFGLTTVAEPASFKIQDYIKQATDFLNSPENLALAEGASTMQQVKLPDGRTINVYPTGLAQEFTEDNRVKVYNASGDVVLNQTQAEYKKPGYLSPVVRGLLGAAGAAVLGPAGSGLLGTTGAAAAGAGGSSLLTGGSLQDALKSAALGGLTAYTLDQLLASGTDFSAQEALDLTLADDIKSLADQGLSQDQISQVISAGYGVDVTTAADAVANALSGAKATATTGQAATGTAGQAGTTTGGLLSTTPSVTVTGTPAVSGAAAGGGLTGGLLTTQTVPVTGTKTGGTASTVGGTASTVGGPTIPTQTVPVTGSSVTGGTSSVTGGTSSVTGGTVGSTIGGNVGQTVSVEAPKVTTSVTTAPVSATVGAVTGGAGGLGGTGGQGGTASASNQLNLSLLDAAAITALLGGVGSLLNDGGAQAPTVNQAYIDSILNAPRPGQGPGITIPGAGYQTPGMFQIAPTNVYNPFATTAPFGTGRFGGFAAPITLPRGLI